MLTTAEWILMKFGADSTPLETPLNSYILIFVEQVFQTWRIFEIVLLKFIVKK